MSKAILIVLDGFGIGPDSPYNAIRNARKPFFDQLFTKYPHSQLYTHGECVGLPDGVMGNSEVGHATMGAGRVLYQDLTRISNAIGDGSFATMPRLREFYSRIARTNGRAHFMGLVSDGGVHSTLEHLLFLLKTAADAKVPEVYVHAFLDGRDTAPDSSSRFLTKVEARFAELRAAGSTTKFAIASLSGRYYSMDRDNRWDRVERAYRAITGGAPTSEGKGWKDVVDASHVAQITDEFVEPITLDPAGVARDGDGILFFNFRSDRAREITETFVADELPGFVRGARVKLADYLGMTRYDAKSKAEFLFGPQSSDNLMGSWLEGHSKRQLRLAETEKYAHVTFFFNGGREKPFEAEDRILVASPKDVAIYDLKPEMSAPEVAERAKAALESSKYDFVVMNFANADMVGHTGNYEAALRAIETLDTCVEKVIGAAERNGFHTFLTADHGNAEEMRVCTHDHDREGHDHAHYGGIHTQHTLNPVPAVWVAPGSASAPRSDRVAMEDGNLADVMPTLCKLMNLPIPGEVTGTALI